MSGLRLNCKERAFTLAELLVSMAILLAVSAPLITTMKISAERLFFYIEYTKAHIRISRTESLLKAPFFYCGLGMPVNASEYKESFKNQKYDPFRWNGPISVTTGASKMEESELRIVYVRPGSTNLSKEARSASEEAEITLNKFPEQNEVASTRIGDPADLGSWMLFPTAFPPATPFLVTEMSGKKLTIKNFLGRPSVISKNDRPHHLRAIKIYCLNDCVYTADYRTAGDQPRVAGIQDLRFRVDPEKGTAEVYILARGDRICEGDADIHGGENWPPELLEHWIVKGSKYRLFAEKSVWSLPNLRRFDEGCEIFKNVRVQY